jgi:hypothetical protein
MVSAYGCGHSSRLKATAPGSGGVDMALLAWGEWGGSPSRSMIHRHRWLGDVDVGGRAARRPGAWPHAALLDKLPPPHRRQRDALQGRAWIYTPPWHTASCRSPPPQPMRPPARPLLAPWPMRPARPTSLPLTQPLRTCYVYHVIPCGRSAPGTSHGTRSQVPVCVARTRFLCDPRRPSGISPDAEPKQGRRDPHHCYVHVPSWWVYPTPVWSSVDGSALRLFRSWWHMGLPYACLDLSWWVCPTHV